MRERSPEHQRRRKEAVLGGVGRCGRPASRADEPRQMTVRPSSNDNGRPVMGQPLRISIVFDGKSTTETSQSGFYHPPMTRSRGRPDGYGISHTF
jgi:hypothetical protein